MKEGKIQLSEILKDSRIMSVRLTDQFLTTVYNIYTGNDRAKLTIYNILYQSENI